MNDETTRLINEEPQGAETSEKAQKFGKGATIGAGVGGFVVGAAVGVAASAAASPAEVEADIVADPAAEADGTASAEPAAEPAPAPEEVILANDEGIRYAHVEADNFSDAFAQARSQVGPGGVFEYNGRLYGTYYADEWNSMTAEERADYQHRVFEGMPAQTVHHHNDNYPQTADMPADAEMIDSEPVDDNVHVIEAGLIEGEDGNVMTAVLIELEGDQALLVDVDNDGRIDVLVHDDNGNAQIDEGEIHAIGHAGIEVNDLLQQQAAEQGNYFPAANDGMPDYINDADSTLSV